MSELFKIEIKCSYKVMISKKIVEKLLKKSENVFYSTFFPWLITVTTWLKKGYMKMAT